jgi:hypothetical protein
MEVLSFKLSVSSGDRFSLRSTSPHSSSRVTSERFNGMDPVVSQASDEVTGWKLPKQGRHFRFDFVEALQNRGAIWPRASLFREARAMVNFRKFTTK